MKVDTKKMTPMSKVAPNTMKDSPDAALFHHNKYIQDGASPLNNKYCHEEESEGGSWIRWIPTIFYTPVKCSQRTTDKDNGRKDTLDAKGVEDLNKAFSKLLIGDKEEQKEETKDHEDDDDDDQENEEPAAPKEKLGRFEMVRESKYTTQKIKVIRSYRLTDEEEA